MTFSDTNGMPVSLVQAPKLRNSFERCEDEPIRIPGSIQRHGFLLLLDNSDHQIVGVSENANEFLGIPLESILGAKIDSILEVEVLGAFRLHASSDEQPGGVTYLGAFALRAKLYSVVTHRVSGQRIVEFESLDRIVNPDLTNQILTNFVGQFSQIRSEQQLCDALARQVSELTKYDRVLVYSFDEAGHGTVVSEENDGCLSSYLGLRFPASDIPQQARDLYVLNTVRIIPDADYIPSPLRAATSARNADPIGVTAASEKQGELAKLDLSNAMLRSVSPIHLDYMRNMGTRSSMSISIVCEGRLWGLISGHHATPHLVPYLIRSACDLLTKLVCTQLISLRSDTSLKKMVHFQGVQRRVLTQMAADTSYLDAVADQMNEVIQIADAAGAALVIDGKCTTVGDTPDKTSILRLAKWMEETPELEVLKTCSLSKKIDWAQEIAGVASGLLAIRISYIHQSYLMWFRPEVLRTVRWAGQPATDGDSGKKLRPRASFETWKEQVRGTSTLWTEMEVASATEFRSAIMTINLKRAEEAIQLGEARFRQLTQTLPHPVWTGDDDGQLTFVNQLWLDQGLLSRGRWYEQDGIVLEDQKRCAEAWKQSVAQGIPFDREVRLKGESEEGERLSLVRAIPYLRADGSRAGWVGTCTDLTDRRQREATLRMTEKLALTGRMTSVIAHEINNPLESLTNLLYLLSGHVKEDPEARGYIGLAEGELQRISGIARQTLLWAREDLQKSEYGSLLALLQDVLRLYAGQIRNKDVQIVMECPEDVRIYGTLGQITQVIANLLSNAVQAVPVGGHIWLSYAVHTNATEFIIRDEGHGMTRETLQNLFKPFHSTKGDLGNGLGLYISQEIVQRHRGKLTVESVLGKGTEIRLRLPNSSTLPTPGGSVGVVEGQFLP
jgi:light-regulated signal transduction histidine kinase (bacteriophytochrome)